MKWSEKEVWGPVVCLSRSVISVCKVHRYSGGMAVVLYEHKTSENKEKNEELG